MTVTAPTTMTAAPASPDRADRATFAARAVALDDFTKNTHIPEVQAAIDNVYANAVDAYASALAAAGSATAAGAVIWISGTTYAAGDARYSPADGQTYRRKTSGAGTTDPSLDGANWVRVNLTADLITRAVRTGNTTLLEGDKSALIDASGTWTQTLDAAAALGNGWYCYLRNTGNGDITLDPSASELIDGASTYTLKPGYTILLVCDGSALHALTTKARTYTFAQYTASTTFTVPAETYVIRPYVFGAGGTGVGMETGGGGGCAYGDVAVTPGEVVTVTIASGVATVTTAGIVRVTGNPASRMTAGTASKHASVTNGGAYSGGSGFGAYAYGGASSGSPLGTGYSGGFGGGGGWGGWGGAGTAGGGGGVGGPGVSNHGSGGGLTIPSTDPLLFGLTSPSAAYVVSSAATRGSDGGPGAGGGASGAWYGGNGGMGGGGGYGGVAYGGAGGFGGGGGGCGNTNFGGTGGYGGGGGTGASGPLAGGAAVIRIYY